MLTSATYNVKLFSKENQAKKKKSGFFYLYFVCYGKIIGEVVECRRMKNYVNSIWKGEDYVKF